VNQRPTKTLFVINFDPIHTRVEDIKRHFERYGEVLHVRIRRNFAFVQFETQEDATKALQRAHMTLVNIFLTMLLVKMAWLYFSFLDQMINIL
jgi:arginine/serine-rich splicing factor 4/5/6